MAVSQGWYDDPQDPSRLRYWDGQQWSQQTSPKPGAAPAAPAYQPPGGPAAPRGPVDDISSAPTQVVPPSAIRNPQPTAVYPQTAGGQPYQPGPGPQGYQAGPGAPGYPPGPGGPGGPGFGGPGSPYQQPPGYPPGVGAPSPRRQSRVGLWLGIGAAVIILLVILGAVLANNGDNTAANTTTAAPTTAATTASSPTTGATTTLVAAPSTKVPASQVSAPAGGKGAQAASNTAKKIIEGTLATRLNLGTITATCPVPPDTNVGTTFTCTSPTKFGTINWLATIKPGDIVDVVGQNVIPADDVPKYAAAAVDVLEKQAGTKLGIQNFVCPPGPIVLNASNQFVCALTDPSDKKLVYDATITVTNIDDGSFVVRVADKPR